MGDLAATVVAWHEGRPVTIGEVADVRLGPAFARGMASVGGRAGVVLAVQKAPATNTLALTRDLDRALDALPVPAGMAVDRAVFRQADFIALAIGNLRKVLIEAAVIVAAVLLLILVDARATLITLVALPLSLAVAVLAMAGFGLTMNVMTLGGLAVALGGLVDDAIIDVENVVRRLAGAAPGAERLALVRAASNEVRQPMVVATAIIVLVFVPLLFMGGLEGRFFQPLGIAYIVSTLASLVVAASVTPALCLLLLRRRPGADHGPGLAARLLMAAYAPVLEWCLRRRRQVVVAAGALAVASLALASTFGSSFLPAFLEGTWQVQINAPPGTSLAESDRLAAGIERRLAAIDGVRAVARRTGRAERDAHAEPPSASELVVAVHPGRQAEVRRAIDAVLAEVPGLTTAVGQPIEHRLSHVLSGVPAALAITIPGEDLDQLRAAAAAVAGVLNRQPGARDVVANREVLAESVPVAWRHDDLARAGLTPAEAARQLERAIAGEVVAVVADGPRTAALRVALHPDERATPEQVGDLLLRSPHGPQVRVREVAAIGRELDTALIARQDGRRKAVVSCNVADGENLGDLVAQVRREVDPPLAGMGLAAHYGGQFEAQQEAGRTIAVIGAAVALAVAALLAASLGSWPAALVVMLNLPLALIGGILAVLLASEAPRAWLAGQPVPVPVLSIASLVGFIALFGIAVRNGLLLVGQAQALRAAGQGPLAAVREAARQRLLAIVMTAVTAVIGLIPLALLAGEPGAEILAPLAVVVLGGLVSSTVLNLLVVPAAYAWAFARPPAAPAPPDQGIPPCASPPSP